MRPRGTYNPVSTTFLHQSGTARGNAERVEGPERRVESNHGVRDAKTKTTTRAPRVDLPKDYYDGVIAEKRRGHRTLSQHQFGG